MKKMNYFCFTLALIATVCVTGCSDDDKKNDIPTDPVPVKQVEAVADFDISSRIGWKLSVQGVPYDAAIAGQGVTATPTDDKKPFYFDRDTKNVIISLSHPGPFGQERSEQTPPAVFYQNSPEKLFMFDELRGEYTAGATEHIKGVKLKHLNLLFDFTVKGLPENAVLSVNRTTSTSSLKVYPYQNEENPEKFLAILNWGKVTDNRFLHIQAGDKEYQANIDLTKATELKTRMALKPGNTEYIFGLMFTFDAKLEDIAESEDKKITIENIKVRTDGKWSIE